MEKPETERSTSPCVLHLRLEPPRKEAMTRVARAQGLTLSSWVRTTLFREVARAEGHDWPPSVAAQDEPCASE